MKFPIKNNTTTKSGWISYPTDDLCPCCKKNIQNNFICLNFNGMSSSGGETTTDINLTMTIHHENDHVYSSAELLEVKGSQLDIYVCSIDCMREFFQKMCDEVEKKGYPDKFRDNKINNILK